MREIKFRAWEYKDKKMIQNFVFFETIHPEGKEEFLIPKMTVGFTKEIMQYTGLKDKDGKEIYEGDILRIGNDLVEEVKWVEVGNWIGEKQPMVGFISHGTIYKNSPIEIIGNIYENPELIK